MSQVDLRQLKERLLDAGLEIYRTGDDEVQIAERVRLHIMDAGIRVQLQDGLAVRFTARLERQQFPTLTSEQALARVREAMAARARERGYEEVDARVQEVTDPVDPARVLDVWHEVSWAKRVAGFDEAVDEVRWALQAPRSVEP